MLYIYAKVTWAFVYNVHKYDTVDRPLVHKYKLAYIIYPSAKARALSLLLRPWKSLVLTAVIFSIFQPNDLRRVKVCFTSFASLSHSFFFFSYNKPLNLRRTNINPTNGWMMMMTIMLPVGATLRTKVLNVGMQFPRSQ